MIAISATALVLLVNVGTSVLKKYVMPTFGAVGVHVLVFVLSVLAALYLTYGSQVAGLQQMVEATIAIFCLAVTVYETVLQHLPVFKQEGSKFVG